MSIEMPCGGCGQTLRVPDSAAGKKARCPVCSQINEIPASGSSLGSTSLGSASQESPIAVPTSTEETQSVSPALQWFLRLPDGTEYGPVERSELERWANEGRVTDACLVRWGPQAKWKPATDEFPHLARTAGSANYGHSSPQPQYSTGGVTSPRPSAHASGNVYADPRAASNPYSTSTPNFGLPPGVRPHRSGLVLTFGILAWASCVLPIPGLGLIFGPLSWIFGAQDLKAMRSGTMDRSGEGTTAAGMWLGAIYTVLTIVLTVLLVGFFALAIIADAR